MFGDRQKCLLANPTVRKTFRFKSDDFKALLLGSLSLLALIDWHSEWGVVGN